MGAKAASVKAFVHDGWLLGGIAVGVIVLGALPLVTDLGVRDAARCFAGAAPQAGSAHRAWAYYDKPNHPFRPGSRAQQPPARAAVQLSLAPGQETTLGFGRSESVRSLDVDYKAARVGRVGRDLRAIVGTPYLAVDLLQFRREDGAVLNPRLIRARAKVVGDRVRISLCVDRRSADALGDPGLYAGTVSIIDDRVARTDLPVSVEGAYPQWSHYLALCGLALLAGAWITWVIKASKGEDDPVTLREWAQWSVKVGGLTSIAFGSAAMVAVFVATYVNDPAWGDSILDPIGLVTSAFTAFMGTTTTLHVTGLADHFKGGLSAPGKGGARTEGQGAGSG